MRNTCYKIENGYQHIHADQFNWLLEKDGKLIRRFRYFLKAHRRTMQAHPLHKTVGDYGDVAYKDYDRWEFQWNLLKQDMKIPHVQRIGAYAVASALFGIFGLRIERFWGLFALAIAYDTATAGTDSTTSPINLTHVSTGSNLFFLQSIGSDPGGTDDVTAASYNSVSSTKLGGTNTWFTDGQQWLYYQYGVAAGSATASTSFSGATSHGLATATYTGASQSGFPDSENYGSVAGASLTVSTTVVTSDCWLIAACAYTIWSGTPGGAGTTVRITSSTRAGIADSNGIVGTGSQSLIINGLNAGQYGALRVCSLAPASATGWGGKVHGISSPAQVSGVAPSGTSKISGV